MSKRTAGRIVFWFFAILLIAGVSWAAWNNQPFHAEDAVGWLTNYPEALQRSQQTGKPMLIDFSADWCPPCRAMKRDVFSIHEVGEYLRAHYVPLAVDLTSPDGPANDLSNQHRIEAIPTLIVLTADGQTLSRHTGGMSASELVKWLSSIQ